jgi:hypothetical protein
MIAALAKLRRRSPAEQRLLVQSVLTLALMRAAIRLPFATVSRMMGLHQGESSAVADAGTVARAEVIGWAVRTAASHTPWESTCLVQALAAAALLRRRHIEGTLYLGVAKQADAREALSAHAWLRCGELVLTGDAGRLRYTPIASFASTRRGARATPASGQLRAGVGV